MDEIIPIWIQTQILLTNQYHDTRVTQVTYCCWLFVLHLAEFMQNIIAFGGNDLETKLFPFE